MSGKKSLTLTRGRQLRARVVLLLIIGAPLMSLFLLNPALGAAVSAAATLLALVLALSGGEQ